MDLTYPEIPISETELKDYIEELDSKIDALSQNDMLIEEYLGYSNKFESQLRSLERKNVEFGEFFSRPNKKYLDTILKIDNYNKFIEILESFVNYCDLIDKFLFDTGKEESYSINQLIIPDFVSSPEYDSQLFSSMRTIIENKRNLLFQQIILHPKNLTINQNHEKMLIEFLCKQEFQRIGNMDEKELARTIDSVFLASFKKCKDTLLSLGRFFIAQQTIMIACIDSIFKDIFSKWAFIQYKYENSNRLVERVKSISSILRTEFGIYTNISNYLYSAYIDRKSEEFQTYISSFSHDNSFYLLLKPFFCEWAEKTKYIVFDLPETEQSDLFNKLNQLLDLLVKKLVTILETNGFCNIIEFVSQSIYVYKCYNATAKVFQKTLEINTLLSGPLMVSIIKKVNSLVGLNHPIVNLSGLTLESIKFFVMVMNYCFTQQPVDAIDQKIIENQTKQLLILINEESNDYLENLIKFRLNLLQLINDQNTTMEKDYIASAFNLLKAEIFD